MVDWYLRLEDCSKIRKSSRTAEHDEIFAYTGKAIPRNVAAETIIWKCFVYNFRYRGSVQKHSKNDKHFFCRSQFDAKTGKISTTYPQYYLEKYLIWILVLLTVRELG